MRVFKYIPLLSWLIASPSWAAIAFVNAWSNNNTGSSNSITIATNTGSPIVNSGVICAFYSTFPNGGAGSDTTSAPTGGSGNTWTTVIPEWTSSSFGGTLFCRLSVSADATATFTLATAGNSYITAGIVAFSGQDTTTPIGSAGSGDSGTGTSINATGIVVAINDAAIWCANSGQTITVPTGWTSAWNIAGSGSVEGGACAYKLGLSAGNTGTISGTNSGATQWLAALADIQLVASGGGGSSNGFFIQ